MPRTLIRDLAAAVGEEVTVYGWVNALRLQRKLQFVIVRDHTGLVQITNKRTDEAGELEQLIEHGMTPESAVKITGVVISAPNVKLGGLEIQPTAVEVVSRADAMPIDRQTGIDQRLDWRFLDVRQPERQLTFAVQTTLEEALREFAYAEGCTEMHTPKLMGTASESGSEVFAVKYFDRTAYLAQSPQFYKQMAIAGGIDKVFEIGPVFRAEPSFTSRHSTEFTGLDVEIAWIEDVEDVMRFEERMLAHALRRIEERHGEAIREIFGVEVTVPDVAFPRYTMAEAISLLRARGWDPEGVKEDLDPEGERMISRIAAEEHGSEFVFITEFPISVRPFYHLRPEHNPDVTASFDLLWKGLEITTGAQREHRHDVLLKQAEEKGLGLEPLTSYTDCFRFGTPPHGGFGAGVNRILMVLLGLESIRDAMFLFRGPNRLTP
ncbi:aspartate--tRNA(Asn) ligase [Couchioplanes caeruleus]|uniref:Aspartate--tRNA ligase n=2 Tax=Couchioplanes caeruleus TaxID=56438 RepID=A0A1K0FQJ2_9ACTN|nr:aspartate--tRNA(Asn) ligase [Couchioplanes caeruleus]OJF14952.1 aspartate--tRNA(Asn) ligase [Couchioplanes caeruleus subsp. caeruleus]ROP30442.1 aspartyl-tRNA synthetase [Couchioplanes caeruleus]